MEAKGVMKPKLRKQVKAFSPFDATRRSLIHKHNISDFFKYLYAQIYEGKVKSDPWGGDIGGWEGSKRMLYSYNTDVTRIEKRRKLDTEVKATNYRSYQVHSSVKQESNNLCEFLLRNRRVKDRMMIEYAFFIYGQSNMDLNGVRAPTFIRNIAASKKKLLVTPFPLFLFLLYHSKFERRNQTTSWYGKDEQPYHIIRGGMLNKLLTGGPLSSLFKGERDAKLLEELSLTDLKPERYTSPPINVFYRFPTVVEPFPIVRYSMNRTQQKKATNFLLENHEDITRDLHLLDLYSEMKKIPF